MPSLRFHVDDHAVEVHDRSPTTTLLQWLRGTGRTGTKEGCAEGDCGACTVLLMDAAGTPRAVNACLVLLPQVDGLRMWTVQGLADGDDLHPAQAAMVDHHGSQCGYCTPGFVMAMAEAAHRPELADADPADWRLDDQVCGNLCRCTGYAPIRDALRDVAGARPDDCIRPHIGQQQPLPALDYAATGQRFFAPDSLADALAILDRHPDARIVCGSTDLGLDVTQRHVAFPTLLSLERARDLGGIRVDGDRLHIGATTVLSDLESWSEDGLPVLHRMLRYFGSRQIKHRASVGGNLCNASPIGDLAPVFLALDATLLLASKAGERHVPIADFFTGYRATALRPGELLAGVQLDRPDPSTRLGVYKVSRRRELDISAVSACFAVRVEGGTVTHARLAFGGMAATPIRATAAEAALVGASWNPATVEAAIQLLPQQLTPLDDHRGSAWFRRTVAGNLLRGFYQETRVQPFTPLPPRHSGTVTA